MSSLMRVLIVDDENPARRRLRRLLESSPGIEVVAEAANGEQCLDLARHYCPDLVLLDIHMPGMDGLDAARQMATWETAPHLVFCTAYDEHALAAFEVAALDYLVKPIEAEKLKKALQRVRKLSAQNAAPPSPSLVVTTAQGSERLALSEVVYLKAEQKYVVAVHRGGEALLRESLQQLENDWSEYFVRVHRNTLIARHYLRGIVREGVGHRALLHGVEDRPQISRRHLQAVKAALAEH